ncbi:hypothetical protein K440DRAFT_91584 [Wilcoxina mikolae CBS 423.85]|nr:hypothetical protein K440DRAFT_91584 [Wilcoxina mikolae CBS 423.85]
MTLHESPNNTTSGQPASWEAYPSRETARISCLDGIRYIRDRLERDLERLFSDQVNVDVLSLYAGERVLVQSYTDRESLNSFLETKSSNNSESIVMLKQRNTYASLQITSDLFKRLLAVHKVFPPFLNYIHSFGYRRSAGDEFFNSYHCRYFSSPGGVKDGSYEFCYNIRYAAKNGRKTNGSPWSIRHMAIYEQHDSTLGSSRWIMVQPSDDYKAQVVEYLDSEVSATGGTIDPLVLHAMLFDSSERDWKDYINDLEEELKVLEEKALFSRVGRVHPADFSVTFSDLQALHRLRKKMLKVHGILDSTVEIATGYEKHCHKLRDSGGCAADHFIFAQMDIIMAQLRNHKRSMFMLLEQSESITKLK